MKLFTKLLIAALVVGVLLPFTVLKGKDGQTLMSFSDLKVPDLNLPDMPDFPDLPKSASGDGVLTTSGDNTVIYQWKDNDGNIQFTSSPPADGIEYTSKGYDPNTNVIQSVKLPEAEPEPVKVKENSSSAEGTGSPYSPEKIQKLLDDAKNVEKLLNDRLDKQNALIGE